MEQELVRRNAEQRLCQFRRLRQQKILDILAGQQQGGLFLPRPLHARPDVSDGCFVVEIQVQFINGRDSISGTEQFIVHIAENIEQHRVAQVLPRFQQGFYTECDEPA